MPPLNRSALRLSVCLNQRNYVIFNVYNALLFAFRTKQRKILQHRVLCNFYPCFRFTARTQYKTTFIRHTYRLFSLPFSPCGANMYGRNF